LLTIDFFGGVDDAEAIVQQPDGKLVIGGFESRGGVVVFAMTRLALQPKENRVAAMVLTLTT
jgi:hypothetical protein